MHEQRNGYIGNNMFIFNKVCDKEADGGLPKKHCSKMGE